MAAEANPSLLRQSAIVILARQAAMREVKRRRQKQGLRETLPHSTLARLDNEWLHDHPELLAVAACRRRTADPKRELPCRNQVRNGGQG
jgi:hypothetical protein